MPVGRVSTLEPRTPEQNVLFARGRPEPDRIVAARQHDANRRYEVHIDVLRSELNAAMQHMEHRERWWMTGLCNAEAAVGMDMDRLHASEVAAATTMEAQMATLLRVLRTKQNRAERSSMAALGRPNLDGDPDAYVKRLATQGRRMMTKSEQK